MNSGAIQYVGLPGISQSCLDAVRRFVQYGDHIERATILTSVGRMHCLLLVLQPGELVAVKSGFASGYSGEGPRTFSEALSLLASYDVDIEECEVDDAVIARLDASSLTDMDLQAIESAKVIRPSRVHDYIYEGGIRGADRNLQWALIRSVMPWSLIDGRITDLALRFFAEPDDSLHRGFRRLEDTIRARLHSSASSSQLMSQAFQGESSRLIWKGIESGEQSGRAQLFVGVFLAYRNPRAHRELKQSTDEALAEFLLLNHLFVLESTSVNRPASPTSVTPPDRSIGNLKKT